MTVDRRSTRRVHSDEVIALPASVNIHFAEQWARNAARPNGNLPRVCGRPASDHQAQAAQGREAARPSPPNRDQRRPTGEPRGSDDRRASRHARRQDCSRPRRDRRPARARSEGSLCQHSRTDQVACVDAGSTGSIHDPLQLGGDRPVRIAQLGSMVAGQDEQAPRASRARVRRSRWHGRRWRGLRASRRLPAARPEAVGEAAGATMCA